MKALVLTSNKLRHLYFIKTINEKFNLVGIVTEDKGNYYNKPQQESEIIRKHFFKLEETEKIFFEKGINNLTLKAEVKKISRDKINNKTIINWAKDLNPDVIFLFGTGILKDEWLNSFDKRIINLHLGLSPFYRGSATLFWPFVNDELECLGATIHIAEKRVDSGNILARIKPEITSQDNYYIINYKLIKIAIESLPDIAYDYLLGKINTIKQNIANSKVYKKSDFNEDVLAEVLKKYGKKIPEETILKIKKSKKCYC